MVPNSPRVWLRQTAVGKDAHGAFTRISHAPTRSRSPGHGEIQEEHGNANGDVGKTENSLISRLRVENGSTPAQTETRLRFKVRYDSPRMRLYKGAITETNL